MATLSLIGMCSWGIILDVVPCMRRIDSYTFTTRKLPFSFTKHNENRNKKLKYDLHKINFNQILNPNKK